MNLCVLISKASSTRHQYYLSGDYCDFYISAYSPANWTLLLLYMKSQTFFYLESHIKIEADDDKLHLAKVLLHQSRDSFFISPDVGRPKRPASCPYSGAKVKGDGPMRRARFISLDQVLGGYIKTFLWIWAILFVILLFIIGISYWGFFGALPISFIIAIFVYWLLCIGTGVKGGIN